MPNLEEYGYNKGINIPELIAFINIINAKIIRGPLCFLPLNIDHIIPTKKIVVSAIILLSFDRKTVKYLAAVAELVDARDLKSRDSNVMWVRFPPAARCVLTLEKFGE